MSGDDRRRAPRARVTWPIVLEPMSGPPLEGRVLSISTVGLKVSTAADLVRGSAVTLRVSLPGAMGRLEVVGRVTRVGPDGLALQFVALPRNEAGRIQDLVVPWDARRRAPRVSVRLPIAMERESGEAVRGESRDLSLFGARVAAPSVLEPGEPVALELGPSDGGDSLKLQAVVWDSGARGSVLVFANVAGSTFDRLSAWLATLQERPE